MCQWLVFVILQADVVYRIAALDSIPPGVVNELNEVLTDEMKQAGSMVTKVGGVEPVAEILNAMDKASETRILSTIEESNPDLAEQIRELMFTFEDLTLIDSKQMQTVLKDVDKETLGYATIIEGSKAHGSIVKGPPAVAV